ncbi:hypothetical protein A2867_02940 [Candidatus Daviesbacteria bacterium RIFCSPHIGHO2_01_FULL_40_11]|uniref:Uncharacterized protein n=1 Tax=Candidatus Daviesbacteria bacterium RIFCSPHIGHO2_01_FULL_40_11 TaxID=1797762 RepID=A0A1F5JM97_9BACT|nr:MAG: hypothetical protein A2867_02940 [Candidatus Daviesbacteria bacterium RIFCSPHIGHO2_01_FULL_40_11]OGE63111.1 MAG: hypothetical protein A2964_01470 [Candidatus Daviesbacteria bacterium RIFCSPLOWO2_01_FULL_40_27]
MIEALDRQTKRELARGFAILEQTERQDEYCPLSAAGLPLWDGEGVAERQALRRLGYTFVHKSTQEIRERVNKFIRFGIVTQQVPSGDGITKRKHSHNRTWGPRYGNFSPRSVLGITPLDWRAEEYLTDWESKEEIFKDNEEASLADQEPYWTTVVVRLNI